MNDIDAQALWEEWLYDHESAIHEILGLCP